MSNRYPFYTEPTHDQGTVALTAGNAARTTATSVAEGRMIVDVVDKVFLLEPIICWAATEKSWSKKEKSLHV